MALPPFPAPSTAQHGAGHTGRQTHLGGKGPVVNKNPGQQWPQGSSKHLSPVLSHIAPAAKAATLGPKWPKSLESAPRPGTWEDLAHPQHTLTMKGESREGRLCGRRQHTAGLRWDPQSRGRALDSCPAHRPPGQDPNYRASTGSLPGTSLHPSTWLAVSPSPPTTRCGSPPPSSHPCPPQHVPCNNKSGCSRHIGWALVPW